MRQTSKSQEIRVGVVSILALLALIGGIVWGKGCGFGVENQTIRMSFANASGIDVGSPLTFNGVRKGSVTALQTTGDQVLVTALFSNDVPLKSDALARIEMAELTGGKKIEIRPGASTTPLAAGDIIPGSVAGDPAALIDNVGQITEAAKGVVARLDTSIGAVNSIIADERFQRSVQTTLLNLEEASQAARDLVYTNRAELNGAIRNFTSAARELNSMVSNARPGFERTLASAEGATGDLRRTIRVADSALFHADTLLVRLDSMARDLRQGKGAVSMLLYDTTFANDLRNTLKSTRALLDQTRKHGFNLNIGLGSRP